MTRWQTLFLSCFHNGAATFVALFLLTAGAAAQSVEVRGGGGLVLTGDILGFDGTYLRLETEFGVLTLDYAAVSCDGSSCPSPEDVPVLRFQGEARIGTLLLPALIEAWALARGAGFERSEGASGTVRYRVTATDDLGAVAFDIVLATTEAGFAGLLTQEADVLMATRALSADEIAIAAEAGLGALDAAGQVRVLAFDALVPVVAPGHAVPSVSLDDLSRLYSGEIGNWADLGGPDLAVTLHLEAAQSGQVQAFVRDFLRDVGRQPSAAIVHHADTDALLAAVLEEPGALGIAPDGEIRFTTPLPLREACGAHPAADPLSVQSEDYPLTFPQFLYRPERHLAEGHAAFLAWLSDAEAQIVLRRASVPGQDPEPVPPEAEGPRLAAAIRAAGPEIALGDLQEMLVALDGLQRFTLTFRFEDGAEALDAPSRAHARYLAHEIAAGRYAGRRLVFVGFSDGNGPAADNLALSRIRAGAVRDAVLAALGGRWPQGVTPEVMAFGEALPIGCDDSVWGRRTNRRVELWSDVLP